MEITTIDTHTPDGYLCDKCKKNYKNQYANVIECQSKQINDSDFANSNNLVSSIPQKTK